MKKSKLYKCASLIFKPMMKLLYRVEIRGLDNIPKDEKCIICPNHTSNIDPILLIAFVKRQIYFMAKAELFKNKLFAKILNTVGVFPVNRGKRDMSAIERSEEILNNGEALGLFIEGTRSKNGTFLNPKAGCAMIAFKTKSPIIPVCITGKNEHKVKILKENIISIGKPILPSQLNIIRGTAKELRDASKFIMDNIKSLK